MKPELAQVFEAPLPVYQQVTDRVRRLIQSGELSPGERLPSTHDLARQWRTNVKTVHQGLSPLVKEGLLLRAPKRGTFVRQREEKLTCVGVYLTAGSVTESRYLQAVQAALKTELDRVGIEMDVWLDPRPEKELRQPWEPLFQAAHRREFQAAIILTGDPCTLAWQRKLPVPLAVQGGLDDMSYCVYHDYQQQFDLPLNRLVEQGCRSVGLIYPYDPAAPTHDGSRSRWIDLTEHFLERCQELKVRVKNEWMRLARAGHGRTYQSQPEFGYGEFRELWRQPEKPEGLIVFPDTAAQGVILGLREQHVRVAEELKLVLHKNESIGLLCPMPASLLVTRECEVAQALVLQIQRQFRGERTETILLSYRLEAHDG